MTEHDTDLTERPQFRTLVTTYEGDCDVCHCCDDIMWEYLPPHTDTWLPLCRECAHDLLGLNGLVELEDIVGLRDRWHVYQ